MAEVFFSKVWRTLFFSGGYNAFLLRRPQRVFRVNGIRFRV